MSVFTHSGKLGDVIASLPTIRALGGGDLRFTIKAFARNLMDRPTCDSMSLLLAGLPYITSVRMYTGEPADYNLDVLVKRVVADIRRGPGGKKPLTDYCLESFGLPLHHRDEAWITGVPCCVPQQEVLINRTFRTRNDDFPWRDVLKKFPGAVFVGFENEYDDFQHRFGLLPRVATSTVLELAMVVSGCKLFLGNQSLALWLAEAMKKPIVVECWKRYASNVIPRPDAIHWFGGPLQLPDV